MTVEQLKAMQQAQPFLPYRIHMADGRDLDVQHRDFVARSPSGRAIVVYKHDETFEVVDLRRVASLEVLDGKGNGRRGRSGRGGKSKA
jgi:hypothetical protein